VLKAVALPAMPLIKEASRAVNPRPSMPVGKYWAIAYGIAMLYELAGASVWPRLGTMVRMIRPGKIARIPYMSFGKAAIRGVRWEAAMSSAARARCTTRKSVHQ
jgi:hypothetical protein